MRGGRDKEKMRDVAICDAGAEAGGDKAALQPLRDEREVDLVFGDALRAEGPLEGGGDVKGAMFENPGHEGANEADRVGRAVGCQDGGGAVLLGEAGDQMGVGHELDMCVGNGGRGAIFIPRPANDGDLLTGAAQHGFFLGRGALYWFCGDDAGEVWQGGDAIWQVRAEAEDEAKADIAGGDVKHRVEGVIISKALMGDDGAGLDLGEGLVEFRLAPMSGQQAGNEAGVDQGQQQQRRFGNVGQLDGDDVALRKAEPAEEIGRMADVAAGLAISELFDVCEVEAGGACAICQGDFVTCFGRVREENLINCLTH